LNYIGLTGEQRRQLIDTQQIWDVWRTHDRDKRRRFLGGMRWVERNGKKYLLRKTGVSEKSLGPKSHHTEKIFTAFMEGREANAQGLKGSAARIDQLARINRAMGIGRLPVPAARILRLCDQHQLLGEQLFVVGTNALYAYEAMSGVQFDNGLLATSDIDLLLDTRGSLSLAVQADIGPQGLMGILQKADKSFQALRPRSFRAANKDGYLVDLICPMKKNQLKQRGQKSFSNEKNDLEGVEIFGLDGLINAPKVTTIVLDERGYPVPVVAIDPRVYALHKAWLSGRDDRDLLKKKRDSAQSVAVAALAANEMGLDFEGADLSALPTFMRRLLSDAPVSASESETPDW